MTKIKFFNRNQWMIRGNIQFTQCARLEDGEKSVIYYYVFIRNFPLLEFPQRDNNMLNFHSKRKSKKSEPFHNFVHRQIRLLHILSCAPNYECIFRIFLSPFSMRTATIASAKIGKCRKTLNWVLSRKFSSLSANLLIHHLLNNYFDFLDLMVFLVEFWIAPQTLQT